jgi:hypothetical protein
MARNVTLGQLKADIKWQADLTGATTRHVASMYTRAINQSIQRFRRSLTKSGSTHYLTKTTGTFSAGTTSPHPFQILDLSSESPSVVRVYGVDITVGSKVRQLTHVPFTHRGQYGTDTGEPEAWASASQSSIAILPGPDAAYSYCVWYLPVISDLSDDSDAWDGVEGWEEFIVWDVVSRLIVRDQNANAYATVMSERESRWRDILDSARDVTAAGGVVIARDTFGERLSGLTRDRRDPPWR